METYRVIALFVALGLSCGISACALDHHSEAVDEPADLPVVDGIPEFIGPWSAELKEYYTTSESDFFRKALSNGHISEAELLEGKRRAEQCMTDNGLEDFELHDDGTGVGGVIPGKPEETAKEVYAHCELISGWADLSMLSDAMTANPENKDWQAAELQCLIDRGYLPQGSTTSSVEKWLEDAPIEKRFEPAAVACMTDPFGVRGEKDTQAQQSDLP